MKKIKRITFYGLALCMLACCHSNKNKDSDYFNGKIRYISNDSIVVKNVSSKVASAENYGYGMFAVYDSLAIFWNPKFPAHMFSIFNIDTGKEIGYFCNKGRGPGEFINTHSIFQFFGKESDLMTLLYAPNERKIFFWNISQSVMKGTTVYDTIVPYRSKTRSTIKNSRFDYLFYQSEDRLLAKVASIPLSEKEATSPYYEQRTIYTNELVRDYRIYKKDSVLNEISEIEPESFFYSIDAIKPDGSKIVQAMSRLPQINIIDTYTGEVIGSRMKDGPGFSLFETDMTKSNRYYISVQADDNYIYATYWGKERWDGITEEGELSVFDTIHVFDWNGKHIYELKTDRSFLRISLDEVRNRLYTADQDTEEIYYLELNELFQ
jgi:hypothetical protein